MTGRLALCVAVGALLVALALLLASSNCLGHRRILLYRVGVLGVVPSAIATIVLLPGLLQVSVLDSLGTLSNLLGVFGFGATIVLSMTFRNARPATWRVRVGVVIPSRVSFYSELRNGLLVGLQPVDATVVDPYLAESRPLERLSDFTPDLNAVLETRPDYLVMASPSPDVFSRNEIAQKLRRFQDRGGGLIFINNPPVGDDVQAYKSFGYVYTDLERGSQLVAEWVEANTSPASLVLVVAGPTGSAPAQRYKAALEAAIFDSRIRITDTLSWTRESALAAVLEFSELGGPIPGAIVCGNDIMAFGAVQAIRTLAESDSAWLQCKVVGFDGIGRALFSISEPSNPFAATVSTPPSAYGFEIAEMIVSDSTRWLSAPKLRHHEISFSTGQLIDNTNVELMLVD